jgi:hypothetical protein
MAQDAAGFNPVLPPLPASAKVPVMPKIITARGTKRVAAAVPKK